MFWALFFSRSRSWCCFSPNVCILTSYPTSRLACKLIGSSSVHHNYCFITTNTFSCDFIWSQHSYEIGKIDSFLFYIELRSRKVNNLPTVPRCDSDRVGPTFNYFQSIFMSTYPVLVIRYVVYPITSDLGLVCDLLGCFFLDTFHSWTAKLEMCFLFRIIFWIQNWHFVLGFSLAHLFISSSQKHIIFLWQIPRKYMD